MPIPRRQTLIDAVLTRFRGIDGTGSYNFDLSSSAPHKVFIWRDLKGQPWEVSELPCLNIRDGRQDTKEHTTNKQLHRLAIDVEGAVRSLLAPDAQARKLLADVTIAIGVDRLWGGVAYNTNPIFDEIDVVQEGDHLCGFRMRFEIQYRTTNFDPYNE